MICSASYKKGMVSLGEADALFRLEWLDRPIALELAVGEFAGEAASRLQGRGRLDEVRIVEGSPVRETELSRQIAGLLEDAIHERMKGESGQVYGVEGEVRKLEKDKVVLRVALRVGKKRVALGGKSHPSGAFRRGRGGDGEGASSGRHLVVRRHDLGGLGAVGAGPSEGA